MELKQYQKEVVADLTRYVALLRETESLSKAFSQFWLGRQVEVGANGISAYQDVIPGVPNVCYKVPTGGGKTLLACASIKPIFDAMPPMKHRAVVWLVPSDAILTQTLQALRSPDHPYRQRLNMDFAARVEVYSKEELLAGQNFNPATVSEQLTVMVLSYDSFRTSKAEGRKAYQANGALASFPGYLGSPERPIEDADETALFQVINQLNPVVVVDESHHARSKLSLEMLENFNPSFVLDLTATPKQDANIISYVDAIKLKHEHMVKLPVIVYNRNNQAEVISDAIDLRASIERVAQAGYEAGGDYIRPIVLFQAQPKVKEDATSFEKLRAKLVEAGIPEEHIAIKTASIDELKGVNLLSQDCPIRYIITVNALKEGWDCPFAYVLASLANKTSRVDVEQILGRILRQPYVRKHRSPLLNMSYVLASSANFQETIDDVVAALNAAGFTARDHRVIDEPGSLPDPTPAPPAPTPLPQTPPAETGSEEAGDQDDEFLNFSTTEVAARTEHTTTPSGETTNPAVGAMLEQASEMGDQYEAGVQQVVAETGGRSLPQEVEAKVTHYKMNQAFATEATSLKLPQFFLRLGDSLWGDSDEDAAWTLVSKEGLGEGFSLRGKDYTVDISHAAEQMMQVDVRAEAADRPKAFGMNARQQQFLRQYLDSLPTESRINQCTEILINRLDRFDSIASSDIRAYVTAIVSNLDETQLKTLETSPQAVAQRVKDKIEFFLAEYRSEQFERLLDRGDIVTRDSFVLPASITPTQAVTSLGKALYEGEGHMNNLEREVLARMISSDSVTWWHRNLENVGFCINGAINHYPDFIVRTKQDRIVMVETKGAMLKNDDSRIKLQLGRAWANQAGQMYRYYMVFDDSVTPIDGGYTVSEFLSQLEHL
jgi:type III site-specific deoxyribonuclease